MDVRTVGRSDGRTVGRSDGRTVGRSYDDVITKISRMDGLPYFLSNGAPRARAFGARGAPLLSVWKSQLFLVFACRKKIVWSGKVSVIIRCLRTLLCIKLDGFAAKILN